jgi:hypothetical protein
MPLRIPQKPVVTDLPTGAIAQSYDRRGYPAVQILESGRPWFASIWLEAGMVATSLTFDAGATGITGGTHCFFALYGSDKALLRQSDDDTAVTWAAYTEKTMSLATPYTVVSTGWHYGMVCVNAATPNYVTGNSIGSYANAWRAPVMGGAVTTSGVTGTAPSSITPYAMYSNIAPYFTVQ